LIIQVASGLGPAPAVVARRRKTHDSKCRVQWQNLPCPLNRSKENPLGVAFWKSLVIELDLRYSKHGNQEANDRSEQSHSAPELSNFDNKIGAIT
jgi:hypothetical protein